jgi:hypothetical protein
MEPYTIEDRLRNDFTYHRPPADKQAVFKAIREKAKELALLIAQEVPDSRERENSLTRLEESVMHANAGIARQFPAE